jgi:hypothetical protein
MPDERTGSGITWLNSPLRNRQTVDTVMRMLKIGQWYGIHEVRTQHCFTRYKQWPISIIERGTGKGRKSYPDRQLHRR